MEFPVIVRAEDADGYEAQPIGLPELRVTAASADEAVAGVRCRHSSDGLLRQADPLISSPMEMTGNPWLNGSRRRRLTPHSTSIWRNLRKAALL